MKRSLSELASSPTMQPLIKIGGNVLSLLTSTIINRLGTFLVYLLVARYLGAYEFGQFSLGLTYFQTFQLLAIAGLQVLITREVAKKKEETSRYLVTGGLIVTAFSVVSLMLLWLTVWLLGYEADTRFIVLFVSASLFPFALSEICDAIFLAWERMHYIAASNFVVTVVKIGLTFFLLEQGYGLATVVGVIIGTHLLGFVIKMATLLKTTVRPTISIDFSFAVSMVQATLTFLGIRGAKAVLNSLDVIILSKLLGEIEVGLLTAAAQLMVPIGMVLDSAADSMFPVMVRNYEQGKERLRIASEQLFEGMLMIVIPATVGIFMLSDQILMLLYGAGEFLNSSIMLRIMIWTLILRTMTRVLGATLIVSMQEKKTLRILLVDVLATILISPIMIIQFGLVGAAISVLAVRIVDALQHYLPIVQTFPGIKILGSLWKPALSSLGMGVFLYLLPQPNLFVGILTGGFVYLAILGLIMFATVGSLEQIKLAYVTPWVEQRAGAKS